MKHGFHTTPPLANGNQWSGIMLSRQNGHANLKKHCISPQTDGLCFLGPSRGPTCWFRVPQHNQQCWCLLCYTSTPS